MEHRGGYYDGSGALRDMAQNHLLQLLCLVAMEPMVSFDANEIRNKFPTMAEEEGNHSFPSRDRTWSSY